MKTQITLYKQILKTYWQRPLILLLTALFLVFYLSLVFGPTGGNVIQVGARPQAPGRIYTALSSNPEKSRHFQTLSDLLKSVDPAEIRSLSLTKMNTNDLLPDLRPFRNLVYLDLSDFELTQANVDQICQLPKLDALVLMDSRLPSGALQRFGEKVSQLEILASALEASPTEIPKMSKVKLLALHLVNASSKVLEYVTQIPQLQQLTLVRSRNYDASHQQASKRQPWQDIDFSAEQIALLRNDSTLKEVYANWFLMKRIRGFDESTLLPVRALPITYSKSKLSAIKTTVFLSAMLFAILALQLWAHFISPAARLVPNYLVPHRRIAVWILSTATLLLCLVLLRYDVGLLPALSIVLLLPAMCCLFAVIQLSKNTYAQWLLPPMVLTFLLFIPLFSETGFKAIASTAIWFLRGNMLELAMTIITIEVLLIAWSLTKLPAITEMANEGFLTTPAFSPWDRERLQQKQWQKPGNPFTWLLDRGISELHYSDRSTWKMVRLWQRGNTFRPIIMLLFLGMICFISLLFQGIISFMKGEVLFTQPPLLLAGGLTSLCSIGAILPAIIWWRRRKSMAVESLRPVNRKTLVKQLYLFMALDHACLVIGLLIIPVLLAKNAAGGIVEILSLLLLIGLATPLWIVGINATVIVFKQAWVIVGSMFVLYTIAGALVITPIIWHYNLQSGDTLSLQYLCVAVFAAIAGAICLNLFMYYAALKREWG